MNTDGITRVDFVPVGGFPDGFGGSLSFEKPRGGHACWRLGSQSADQFVATLSQETKTMKKALFHTNKLKVFFPVHDRYFAVRSATTRGAPTLPRVLRAIEAAGEAAMAYHLERDLGKPGATKDDVRRLLGPVVCCHLVLRRVGGGNHVYVR